VIGKCAIKVRLEMPMELLAPMVENVNFVKNTRGFLIEERGIELPSKGIKIE
jgi:hypothetical protein